MQTESFIIQGKSQRESGKSHNGDFYTYNDISEEGIVILSLSDGVGSRHYDYVASETACKAFTDSFINNNNKDLRQRFEDAIKAADRQVSNPKEAKFRGMMATLAAVTWDKRDDAAVFENIGDSRIYKYSNKGLEQISSDSKKAVNIRDRSGKLMISDGVLVIREGLTNALGYNGAEIKVNELGFSAGESLILCSDGAYNIEGFESGITELLSRNISEKLLKRFFERNNDYFSDDASILILQRTDQPKDYKKLYRRIINDFSDYKQNDVIGHQLTSYIQSEILSDIANSNKEDIINLIQYIEKYDLRFSEEFIETAIQEMKSKGFQISELYQLLVGQLRKMNI